MIYLSFLLILFSSPVFAGSITYDFRFDSNSTSYNQDFKDLGYDDFSKFYVQTGRLDFKGKLNQELSYRLRWRFDKPAVASSSTTTGTPSNNKRDSLNSSVDFASITHQFAEVVSVTFGKFASEMGGTEGQTPTADMYITSGAFADNFYVDTGRAARLMPVDLYYAGAKLTLAMSEQELSLHLANNRSDFENAGKKLAQNKGYVGLVYKGSWLEKMFKPTASFHTVSGQDDKTKRSYLAIGAQFDVQPWMLGVDFLANELTDTADKKDKITAAVISASYSFENLKPSLKYASSTLQDNSGASELKDAETALALSLEYKPFVDTNFRYHIAYTDYLVKPDSSRVANNSIKRSEIILGLRMQGDFLK
jgi:hypothetical protein